MTPNVLVVMTDPMRSVSLTLRIAPN